MSPHPRSPGCSYFVRIPFGRGASGFRVCCWAFSEARRVGALLVWLVHGFQGVSRISFAVDALLLALLTFGWRGGVGLARVARAAREERASGHDMEDRTAPPSVSAGLLGIFRYRELLRNLVLRDIKLKYRGSVFGFFWSLANPLLMIITYTIAFSYILQVRTEGFVFNLLLGLLNWTFFASSAMMSTGVGCRSRSAHQERRFSPSDLAGGDGVVQSGAVRPHDCRVPSDFAHHVWLRAPQRL